MVADTPDYNRLGSTPRTDVNETRFSHTSYAKVKNFLLLYTKYPTIHYSKTFTEVLKMSTPSTLQAPCR